ncbi:MAG TPA: hypothetical protein VJU53_11470 [Burkholderiaceae bacterium]|nr:hypothetical protein [Burkholderiaceae bacterium]
MRRLLLPMVAALVAVIAVVACSPISALNAIAPTDSHELSTFRYGAGEHGQLDVYAPRPSAERLQPAQGWPRVVFFYGGSWNRGDRAQYVSGPLRFLLPVLEDVVEFVMTVPPR